MDGNQCRSWSVGFIRSQLIRKSPISKEGIEFWKKKMCTLHGTMPLWYCVIWSIFTDASIFALFTTDVCLVVLFMAQHSGLASKWFSSLMNKIGLQVISRSVYILTTTAALQVRHSVYTFIDWASLLQNMSSGFPTKRDSNQSPPLEIEISPVASLDMVPINKRITKALIRLSGCAGWSAPVLFANPRRQVFSRFGPINV